MTERPVRGTVYWMDLGHGRKPWLVVSNNARNRVLDTVVVLRIATTSRAMPTRIDLGADDPLTGQVLCDDIEQVFVDELGGRVGALAPTTMAAVGRGLAVSLSIG